MSATDGSAARHAAEQILYDYTAIADRKDVDSVIAFFGAAVVEFPHRTAQGADELRAHYSHLWAAPAAHRHIVTNVRVATTPTGLRAEALYTRYVLDPAPTLTTMGEYTLHASWADGAWMIDALTVTRTWHDAA
jgi:hypothetical protein